MSDVPDTFNNEMEAIVKQIYPDMPTFKKHLMPFLHPVKEEYESFIVILGKIGIKSVDEYLEILFRNFDTSVSIQSEVFNLMQQLEKQYGDKFAELSTEKLLEIVGSHLSFDNSFSMVTNMPKKDSNVMSPDEMDALTAKLPENENAHYEWFNLFVIKIWVSYIIANQVSLGNAFGHFSKEMLRQYYIRMNQLYEQDIIPRKLIDYIEGIKVPMLIDIKTETTPIEQPLLAASLAIPVFSEIEKVYEVLKKYFDPNQHELLLSAFKGDEITNKLLFKSNGNQLADAFKRLFNASLITGCTKAELSQWIEQNFEYKGRGGERTAFNGKYLNDLISSEQKPCKNPIIDIQKNIDGKYLISSAEKKTRTKS